MPMLECMHYAHTYRFEPGSESGSKSRSESELVSESGSESKSIGLSLSLSEFVSESQCGSTCGSEFESESISRSESLGCRRWSLVYVDQTLTVAATSCDSFKPAWHFYVVKLYNHHHHLHIQNWGRECEIHMSVSTGYVGTVAHSTHGPSVIIFT